MPGRFTLIDRRPPDGGAADGEFAAEVRAGLLARPRRLACRWFYDDEGSRLFEAICDLPEYYLTRAETEIVERHAREIARRIPAGADLVELGSGSARKTRLLVEALLGRGPLRYLPVDISRAMLVASSRALLDAYPTLAVTAVAAEYEAGLAELANTRGDEARLVLWLGSNVGNFDRGEAGDFLARVRATMAARDRFLLGVDLRKDRVVLEAAYDDAAGVTAAFNLNLLARINRELGADFDVASFRHRARYDEREGRIEMYLVSERAQRVRIARLDLTVDLAAGEAIHTENSYKYSPGEIDALARAGCFSVEERWLDAAGRFAVSLLAPR